ncbi:MAG: nucleotidyl transferase AbiEii/AbiGii toxin family protein [Clostridia bacterium]|nr:nucleotidyl transferase AbiEii/AbiGii toxin family protein [Clostridia bacterium]
MLHNEKELFEQVILRTADALRIESGIIEKDYFVTMFLKKLAAKQPDIVFKGGTSLSKCHKLIHRFSEDIDLNLQGDMKPPESVRRKLRDSIYSAIKELELSLENPDDICSRRDFNKYVIKYPSAFGAVQLKPNLVVETAIFFRAYPTQKMQATSFVYDYLSANGFDEVIDQYDLRPFALNVQTADRTLIDKLFALGDYYLNGTTTEHSRHIYDIHKLLGGVEINDDLKKLMLAVREERKPHKTCHSAQDSVDMNVLLQEIVDKGVYKADYKDITETLLFDSVSYETAIEAIREIIASGLFD